MMTERFGEMNSDQEDLVGTSSEMDDDDDDDLDDYYDDDDDDEVSINEEEIMRYAFAKTQHHYTNGIAANSAVLSGDGILRGSSNQMNPNNNPMDSSSLSLSCNNCVNGSNNHNCQDDDRHLERYSSTEKLIMESNLFESKTRLFGNGIVLLVTTFAMLVLLPLYFQQLSLNGERFNVFGATLLLCCNATLVFLLATVVFGMAVKWKIPFHRPPLKWTKLIMISFCYGLSVILFSTGSAEKRVPCHLQDPLKAASLVFALVFYFFFCRKVMGLQRIFSATTTVVGLFIAVDYGLCDEFRCRGTDLTDQFLQSGFLAATAYSSGWKGRAIWTLIYVLGVAFWSLHISLLEGSLIVTTQERPKFTFKPLSLLRTVSRIVASTESSLPTVIKTPTKEEPEKKPASPLPDDISDDPKPHPLHLIVWIHCISLIFTSMFGWIDIFPVQGPIKSLSRHLSDTENTILCHFNVYNRVPDVKSDQEGIDFLSNLIPGSRVYNQTVQQIHRFKRSSPTIQTANNDTQSSKNHTTKPEEHRLEIVHFNYTTHRINTETKRHHYHNNKSNSLHNNNSSRMINKKPPFKPLSVLTGFAEESPAPRQKAHILMRSEVTGNCARVQIYAVVLLLVYLVFAVALINFLLISESAVFCLCVVTASLPLVGIFWSMFEISTEQQTIVLIWSPEISGELICSLLGCPIVFLGIGLLCRAYFNEQILMMNGGQTLNSNSAIRVPVCFENNYYTTCFESGGNPAAGTNVSIEIDDNEGYNQRNIVSNENGNSF